MRSDSESMLSRRRNSSQAAQPSAQISQSVPFTFFSPSDGAFIIKSALLFSSRHSERAHPSPASIAPFISRDMFRLERGPEMSSARNSSALSTLAAAPFQRSTNASNFSFVFEGFLPPAVNSEVESIAGKTASFHSLNISGQLSFKEATSSSSAASSCRQRLSGVCPAQ